MDWFAYYGALVAEGLEAEAAVVVADSALAHSSEGEVFVCVVQQGCIDAGSA